MHCCRYSPPKPVRPQPFIAGPVSKQADGDPSCSHRWSAGLCLHNASPSGSPSLSHSCPGTQSSRLASAKLARLGAPQLSSLQGSHTGCKDASLIHKPWVQSTIPLEWGLGGAFPSLQVLDISNQTWGLNGSLPASWGSDGSGSLGALTRLSVHSNSYGVLSSLAGTVPASWQNGSAYAPLCCLLRAGTCSHLPSPATAWP